MHCVHFVYIDNRENINEDMAGLLRETGLMNILSDD